MAGEIERAQDIKVFRFIATVLSSRQVAAHPGNPRAAGPPHPYKNGWQGQRVGLMRFAVGIARVHGLFGPQLAGIATAVLGK